VKPNSVETKIVEKKFVFFSFLFSLDHGSDGEEGGWGFLTLKPLLTNVLVIL